MFIVTVEIKDHAICTLTPSQGDPIIVKAPKEIFATSTSNRSKTPSKTTKEILTKPTHSKPRAKNIQNSRPLIGYKKLKREKTKKWTKKITSP